MIVLGCDAGGSGTRAVVADAALTVVARAQGGPGWAGDLEHAVAGIREVVAQLASHGHPACAVVGAAGAGDPAAAAALAGALGDIAEQVVVVTDLEIALEAAFGDGPGIVLLAGTGSAAIARLPDGEIVRAGGLGPEHGDQGSAYWLGKRALAAGLVTGLGTSRPAIAGLAPVICRQAQGGDPRARQLVAEGADHLAALVRELAPRLVGARVALGGGLLTDQSAMRAAVEERLRGFTIEPGALDAALGAARLALRRLVS